MGLPCKSRVSLGFCYLEQLPRPVASIADQPQIRKGPFGGAHFVFDFAELIADRYEELAVALALIWGQCQDTCQVVAIFTALLLGEVPAKGKDHLYCMRVTARLCIVPASHY